jgi:hypothetical protein
MSWSYSRALVEEYSEACCSDTELSAQLNTTPMPDQFYWPDKTTEHSRLSRFGMTCVPFEEILGAELLTWYLEDFRAKTSVSPGTGQDWTAKGQGYGEKWQGLLAKYDPDSRSLKTAQLSLLEDSTGCCATLPRWGLMRNGELYPQPMLELRTGGKEYGFWPTPTASDTTGAGHKAQGGKNLRTVVSEMTWPTATATAYKGWSPNHNRADTNDRLDYTAEREAFNPGQQTPPMRLNPDWVEWLMGWPIGHTALKPLATGRFQEFEQQHGICFMESELAA